MIQFNNKQEELAYFTALAKVVNDHVKDLKSEAKGYLAEVAQSTGADRIPIIVGNEKVGQISITYNNASPYPLGNEGMDYLRQCGLVEEKPARGWEKRFQLIAGKVIDNITGEEVSDLFGWMPRSPKTTAVTGCKPQDVAQAFNALQLPDIKATALLEGGEN